MNESESLRLSRLDEMEEWALRVRDSFIGPIFMAMLQIDPTVDYKLIETKQATICGNGTWGAIVDYKGTKYCLGPLWDR